MRNKNFCIIPARGGSKRIPKKNIKEFCGKPIIEYVINNSLKTNLFEKIFVSTDSVEIKNISSQAGAEVPFMRSKELSDDYTCSTEVIRNMILELPNLIRMDDNICCIYPTAVFADKKLIKNSYEMFTSMKISTHLVSCTHFDYPIQRSLKYNDDKLATFERSGSELSRSQDLEECFHDAGMIYWGKAREWISKKNILENCFPFFIPRMFAHDIDNLEDWELAEFIFSKTKKF